MTDREKLPYAELSGSSSPITRHRRDSTLDKRILVGVFVVALVVLGTTGQSLLRLPARIPIRGEGRTTASLRTNGAALSAESETAWRQTVDRCHDLHTLPGPPADFHHRTQSDRYEPEVRGVRETHSLP